MPTATAQLQAPPERHGIQPRRVSWQLIYQVGGWLLAISEGVQCELFLARSEGTNAVSETRPRDGCGRVQWGFVDLVNLGIGAHHLDVALATSPSALHLLSGDRRT